MTEPEIDHNKLEKTLNFLTILFQRHSAYHDQKENMAYGGMLLLIALFGAVLSLDQWPPCWIGNPTCSIKLLTLILFSIFWFTIYFHIRNNLRYKRWASHNRDIMEIAIWKCINEKLSNESLELERPKPNNTERDLKWIVDYIIPFPSAKIRSNLDEIRHPNFVVAIRKEKNPDNWGSIKYEWYITIGNYLLYIIIWLYTFCK